MGLQGQPWGGPWGQCLGGDKDSGKSAGLGRGGRRWLPWPTPRGGPGAWAGSAGVADSGHRVKCTLLAPRRMRSEVDTQDLGSGPEQWGAGPGQASVSLRNVRTVTPWTAARSLPAEGWKVGSGWAPAGSEGVATGLCQRSGRGVWGQWRRPMATSLPRLLVVGTEPGTSLLHSCRGRRGRRVRAGRHGPPREEG